MPIFPDQFSSTPILTLLEEAEQGLIGFDRRLIQALLDRREETLDALEAMLKDSGKDRLLDLTEQAFDLYREFRSPRALPFYIQLLGSRKGDTIPDDLMEAFTDIGAPAVEPILELHGQVPADDRPDLVFLLSTLGVHDARIQALIEATIAADHYEGALCAGLYGDPALKPAVQAALDAGVKNAEEQKVLEECIESLGAPREPHEPQPYGILEQYPEKAAPLFDQMDPEHVVRFFECGEKEYRARAAMSFTDDDYPDEIRDRLIELAQNDSEPLVRGAALRALGERIHEEAIRDLLVRVLETKSEAEAEREEWLGALIGLAGATAEPEVHDALLAAYNREECRAAALQTMWRSLDPRYRKYFGPNLKSEEFDIRRQAIQGVGAYPLPDLAFELIPLLQDEEVRDEALFSYALAVRHNTTPKSVNRLFDMIDEKAGGLSDDEEETVAVALDRRLEREGFEPVFFPAEEHDHEQEAQPAPEPVEQARTEKIGRNDACPCGSGKKYKKCCGAN
ncbi:MAG: HEAT repeat domain-containing protein [Acidobacteria bacterium]|nr:HEAT repeat domain-containing protein [Acidobacteriota bacterium]